MIHVVAGAMFDSLGRVLLAQRPEGKHMAGGWEFPGGKLEQGGERFAGLQRELHEELGIQAQAGEPLLCYEHRYADRLIKLDLWLVTKYSGEPQPREGQPLKWVTLAELDEAGLLEADRPMIPALRGLEAWAMGCRM